MKSSNFRIEPASEADMPRCIEILVSCFGYIPFEKYLSGPHTPEGIPIAAARHLQAWREHAELNPSAPPVGIKCVHTDPDTKVETIVGFAEWFIYDHQRTESESRRENYVMRAEYLDSEADRKYVQDTLSSVADIRWECLKGRPAGILMYMCVDKAWQRQGAASLCVKWGMDRCTEMGVPGFLEASEVGFPTYSRLGWKQVGECTIDGWTCPAMIYEPPVEN